MFYRHFVNGKVPFFKVIAMANIIVGANIQMNGTGQDVHQMQNLAHGINVEFNRDSQSLSIMLLIIHLIDLKIT